MALRNLRQGSQLRQIQARYSSYSSTPTQTYSSTPTQSTSSVLNKMQEADYYYNQGGLAGVYEYKNSSGITQLITLSSKDAQFRMQKNPGKYKKVSGERVKSIYEKKDLEYRKIKQKRLQERQLGQESYSVKLLDGRTITMNNLEDLKKYQAQQDKQFIESESRSIERRANTAEGRRLLVKSGIISSSSFEPIIDESKQQTRPITKQELSEWVDTGSISYEVTQAQKRQDINKNFWKEESVLKQKRIPVAKDKDIVNYLSARSEAVINLPYNLQQKEQNKPINRLKQKVEKFDTGIDLKKYVPQKIKNFVNEKNLKIDTSLETKYQKNLALTKQERYKQPIKSQLKEVGAYGSLAVIGGVRGLKGGAELFLKPEESAKELVKAGLQPVKTIKSEYKRFMTDPLGTTAEYYTFGKVADVGISGIKKGYKGSIAISKEANQYFKYNTPLSKTKIIKSDNIKSVPESKTKPNIKQIGNIKVIDVSKNNYYIKEEYIRPKETIRTVSRKDLEKGKNPLFAYSQDTQTLLKKPKEQKPVFGYKEVYPGLQVLTRINEYVKKYEPLDEFKPASYIPEFHRRLGAKKIYKTLDLYGFRNYMDYPFISVELPKKQYRQRKLNEFFIDGVPEIRGITIIDFNKIIERIESKQKPKGLKEKIKSKILKIRKSKKAQIGSSPFKSLDKKLRRKYMFEFEEPTYISSIPNIERDFSRLYREVESNANLWSKEDIKIKRSGAETRSETKTRVKQRINKISKHEIKLKSILKRLLNLKLKNKTITRTKLQIKQKIESLLKRLQQQKLKQKLKLKTITATKTKIKRIYAKRIISKPIKYKTKKIEYKAKYKPKLKLELQILKEEKKRKIIDKAFRLAKKKRKFVYLPDLTAIVMGERAGRKERLRFIDPRTVFSGLEARRLV